MTRVDLWSLPVGTLLHLDDGVTARVTEETTNGVWVPAQYETAPGEHASLRGSYDSIHVDEIRSVGLR